MKVVVPGDHRYKETEGKRGSWLADLCHAFLVVSPGSTFFTWLIEVNNRCLHIEFIIDGQLGRAAGQPDALYRKTVGYS